MALRRRARLLRAILARLWGEEIPFHVIGRKIYKGYKLEAWQEPLQKKTGLHCLKMYCTTLYNTVTIKTGFKMTRKGVTNMGSSLPGRYSNRMRWQLWHSGLVGPVCWPFGKVQCR